ncbi:MAG: glycosyltransferase [Roseburia sp.]|nr:glycosyltransferase [Roseburia sp.]MCM1243417.1 glycosyltransferase [Roseburia sp.]
MKIIFIIPNMTGGGTERVISLLSDAYIKMGFEVAIMQFAGYEHAYKLNDKVEDFSIAPKSNGNPFIMIKRLAAMRKYFKNNPDSYIFAFCVMGAVFSVMTTFGMKKHILVAERSSPDSCNVRGLRNWAYKRADRITFQTPDGIAYFPRQIASKAVVISNPVDEHVPDCFEGVRSHRIVSVGRLHKVKNHAMLIDAFADFSRRFTDYELHIYGQGELEQELKEQAKRLHISEKIIWHGFCTDVKEKIRDAAMFVLCSNYEGTSNSMLEALSMGIPTIATDCPIGGARVYITPEESGLLIPVDDRKALAEAMTRIASDEEFAGRLSVNAMQIKNKYSVRSVAEKFLEAAGIAPPEADRQSV